MALGKYAVDYEQRVDYPRLRRERVARVRAQMEADGIGAIITWDPGQHPLHRVLLCDDAHARLRDAGGLHRPQR